MADKTGAIYITTVTWSEESDHVKLTGSDHHITRDGKQVTVVLINLSYIPVCSLRLTSKKLI
jgi:hypothetical protein